MRHNFDIIKKRNGNWCAKNHFNIKKIYHFALDLESLENILSLHKKFSNKMIKFFVVICIIRNGVLADDCDLPFIPFKY